MTTNQQIQEFLTYYLNLSIPPQYAVMLKGQWGSGKTFFIKNLISKTSGDKKCLYVSLNGISTKKEIEEEFYRQLHPVLTSKAMRLTGKIFKTAAKVAFRADLDQDGNQDETITIGLPEIDLAEYLENPAQLILVFDDLERCDIKIPEILGYINYFVEHHGHKVLIVANEDEIIEREKNNVETAASYKRIHEKVIGKTLELQSDLNSALEEFLKEIDNKITKKTLQENHELVTNLFYTSKYQNLRHLRQTILEFARLIDSIDQDKRNPKMLRGILGTFLIFNFEIRSGSLIPSEIKGLKEAWLRGLMRPGEAGKLNHLLSKYPMLNELDSVFPDSVWSEYLGTGLIPREKINSAIKESVFYSTAEERPTWLLLWNAFELDDDVLTKALKNALRQLENKGYSSVGELKHVIGTFVELHHFGIEIAPLDQIIKLGRENVSAMRERDEMPIGKNLPAVLTNSSWGGRGFHGLERKEFKDFSNFVELEIEKSRLNSYPKIAEELLKLLQKDANEFARKIIITNDGDNLYYNVPIFNHLDVDDFIKTISNLSTLSLRSLTTAFEGRYEQRRPELAVEAQWLQELSRKLTPLVEERSGMISGFWINLLKEKAGMAAEKLA